MPTYRKNPKTGKFQASNKLQGPTHFDKPQARLGRYDHLHPAERDAARAASMYHEDNQVPKDRDGQEAQFQERRQQAREIEQAREAMDPETEKAALRYGATTPAQRVAPPTYGDRTRTTDRAET